MFAFPSELVSQMMLVSYINWCEDSKCTAANVFNNNNFEVSYIYMLERLDKLLKKKIIPNKHITRPLVEPNLKFSEALHCWFHWDWSSLMLCYPLFCFYSSIYQRLALRILLHILIKNIFSYLSIFI